MSVCRRIEESISVRRPSQHDDPAGGSVSVASPSHLPCRPHGPRCSGTSPSRRLLRRSRLSRAALTVCRPVQGAARGRREVLPIGGQASQHPSGDFEHEYAGEAVLGSAEREDSAAVATMSDCRCPRVRCPPRTCVGARVRRGLLSLEMCLPTRGSSTTMTTRTGTAGAAACSSTEPSTAAWPPERICEVVPGVRGAVEHRVCLRRDAVTPGQEQWGAMLGKQRRRAERIPRPQPGRDTDP